MGSMSIVHWGAVLLIVMLVFGTKKIGNIGADLGKAVKGFKDGVKEEEKKSADDTNTNINPNSNIKATTQVTDKPTGA